MKPPAQRCALEDRGVVALPSPCEEPAWSRSVDRFPGTLKCLNVSFEAKVAQQADATALVCNDRFVSYAALSDRVDDLARQLSRSLLDTDDIVGVFLDPCLERTMAVLAILKTGRAFLPLDPNYPIKRLESMLRDSSCRLVWADGNTRTALVGIVGVPQFEILMVDQHPGSSEIRLAGIRAVELESLAYVLYTSGSTDAPKGVMGTHGATFNRLAWMWARFPFAAGAAICQKTVFNFGDAIWEIFGGLLAGRKTVIADRSETKDLSALMRLIARHQISHLTLVPSLLNVILRRPDLASLKYCTFWVSSGEGLPGTIAQCFHERLPWAELFNFYGSTEMAGDACYGLVSGRGEPHVGRPIANVSIYILDRHGIPVNPGSAGVIYVGGSGLARGYFGMPALTAEAFVPDPFGGEKGARMYRSGDLGCFRADGNLALLGRCDAQIKHKGIRIEPGEIENTLRQIPPVRDARVMLRGSDADQMMLMGWVQAPTNSVTPDQLKEYLSVRLPEYMVPSAFVVLPRFPLLPSGKVDRKALSSKALPRDTFNATSQGSCYKAASPTETKISKIWSEILGCPNVPIDRPFFDFGANSISLMQLQSRLKARLGADLSNADLYRYPSVRALAAFVEAASVESDDPGPGVYSTSRLPLSGDQLGILTMEQIGPKSAAYHHSYALKFNIVINPNHCQKALRAVVAQHPQLRASFHREVGEPFQTVAAAVKVGLPVVDLRGLPARQRLETMEKHIPRDDRRLFQIAVAPLCRFTLFITSKHRSTLVVTFHHLIFDGWSLQVFLRDWQRAMDGIPPRRKSLGYADFVLYQRHHAAKVENSRFWEAYLEGSPQVQALPGDLDLEGGKSRTAERKSIIIKGPLWRRIMALSVANRTTSFTVLQAALSLLLARYNGQPDFLTGTVAANRRELDFEAQIGMFASTYVLRNRPRGRLPFSQWLQEVRDDLIQVFNHGPTPHDQLARFRTRGSAGHAGLPFQVMFSFEAESRSTQWPHLEEVREMDSQANPFDLSLFLTEQADGCVGFANFRLAVYRPATIARFLDHFKTLLDGIVTSPQSQMGRLNLHTSEQRRLLLCAWQGSRQQQSYGSAVKKFEMMAARFPERIALKHRDTCLSYAVLMFHARRLAEALRTKGVGLDSLVGICLKRKPEMVVSLLAVHCLGGAYVPLDPDYPIQRLTAILAEAEPCLILASPETRTHLDFGKIPTYHPARQRSFLTGRRLLDAPILGHPQALSAILYTSGSTGRPKGVALIQNGISQLVSWAESVFSPQVMSGVLAQSSLNFDLSIFEILVTLAMGGTAILVKDVFELVRLRHTAEIRLLNTVPSVAKTVLTTAMLPRSVTTVNLAGEPLDLPLVRDLYATGHVKRVHNLYGPTEDTTYSSMWPMRRKNPILTIGLPFPNTSAHILNRGLELLPVGVAGELYIGGDGLCRGYFNSPAQTAEKFIPDPYGDRPGGRLYLSGDRVYRLGDGRMVCLGRTDRQVKIRGFRVEIGEIEISINDHPQVREAAVTVSDGSQQGKCLTAWVSFKSNDADALKALQRDLADRLPHFMLPANYVTLPKLPKTANGKVDLVALAERVVDQPRKAPARPQSDRERVVCGIMREVLGSSHKGPCHIGVDDNFFDFGGHSLLAFQVVNKIYARFGVTLPMDRFFEHPTAAGLVSALAKQELTDSGRTEPVIGALAQTGPVALSHQQQSLFFIEQEQTADTAYNLPLVLALDGCLDVPALGQSIACLVTRHESLRTTLVLERDVPHQVRLDRLQFDMSVLDLNGLGPSLADTFGRKLSAAAQRRPFQLLGGPLFRVHLLRLAADSHLLLLNHHHIISDGWSMGVLVNDLKRCYSALVGNEKCRCKPLSIQYADYAVWQRQWLGSGNLERGLRHWEKSLDGAPALLQLPLDYRRPRFDTVGGCAHFFDIDEGLTDQMRSLARDSRVSLFSLLLAGYYVLLSRYSGQRDLVIGAPVANRPRAETEPLIGYFANTLALRLSASANAPFLDVLEQTQQTVVAGLANQDVPLQLVVERLKPERNASYSPLFQALLVLQEALPCDPAAGGLRLRSVELDYATAKFDLVLSVTMRGSGLRAAFQYKKALFHAATIARMAANFGVLMAGVVRRPEVGIEELEMVSDEEAAQQERWSGAP